MHPKWACTTCGTWIERILYALRQVTVVSRRQAQIGAAKWSKTHFTFPAAIETHNKAGKGLQVNRMESLYQTAEYYRQCEAIS